MKLLFCTNCHDLFRLDKKLRVCNCGRCYGRYVDNVNVEVSEEGIVVGFDNYSFVEALKKHKKQPNGIPVNGYYFTHKGFDFNAFIIPEGAQSVKRVSTQTKTCKVD